MKLQKVLAGVMVAVLALTAAPVGNVKAADGIPIDEAHFPDAVFRSWVSENCDESGDGSLSDEEIMMTTGIDVEREGINTLKGIEYFTALTWLFCRYNPLTTLDVSENTALEKLYCSYNQLTTLDVSKNTALEQLICYANVLTTLDVSKNTALESLDCGGNQLTTLDVSKNTALTLLYCNKNQLTTLDVSKNTALEYLWCYNNKLTKLDVSKNTALTDLGCSGNYFTQVDVSAQDLAYLYHDGELDEENKILYVSPREDDPSDPVITPDKTISIGDKVTFETKKKIACIVVVVSDDAVVFVEKKGKKVIVTGKSAGIAIVTAYNKKGKELGSWIVKVE